MYITLPGLIQYTEYYYPYNIITIVAKIGTSPSIYISTKQAHRRRKVPLEIL